MGYKFDGKCEELDAEPAFGVVPVESVAGAVCRSVDGVTQSTGSFSTEHNGILFDFALETTIRCDIAVGARDFSKVRGSFTVKALSPGVEVSENKAVTEWHNILSPGEENFTFNIAPTATFQIAETAVTPTKTLRVEVHQSAGAKVAIDFSQVETLNSVSEYVVMSTTVSSLPSRR